ncbi:MAG: hypothetical protein IH891_03210 [Planctomycetes bacterium]|nr:hypothetical protein [Planctomycetota bacterium]
MIHLRRPAIRSPRLGEYDELRWCRPDDLPVDLSPIARQMTSLLEWK